MTEVHRPPLEPEITKIEPATPPPEPVRHQDEDVPYVPIPNDPRYSDRVHTYRTRGTSMATEASFVSSSPSVSLSADFAALDGAASPTSSVGTVTLSGLRLSTPSAPTLLSRIGARPPSYEQATSPHRQQRYPGDRLRERLSGPRNGGIIGDLETRISDRYRPSVPRSERTVLIGPLPRSVGAEDLTTYLLTKVGGVESIRLHDGVAKVVFLSAHAERARRLLHGVVIDGRHHLSVVVVDSERENGRLGGRPRGRRSRGRRKRAVG